MSPILAHILNPFFRLRALRKWDQGMDINPGNETSYTIQCHEAFLKYVENEYSAYHRLLSVDKPKKIPSNNFFPSTMTSASAQSTFDQYDLCSDDE